MGKVRIRSLAVTALAAAVIALSAGVAQAQYGPTTTTTSSTSSTSTTSTTTPGGTGGLTLSDGTPTPGQTLTMTAVDFKPGTTVEFLLLADAVVLGTAQAGTDGTAVLTVQLPATVAPGPHSIQASGTGSDDESRSVTVSLTVVAASGSTTTTAVVLSSGTDTGGTSGSPASLSGGALAFTGNGSFSFVLFGLVLAGLGHLAVITLRRRLVPAR